MVLPPTHAADTVTEVAVCDAQQSGEESRRSRPPSLFGWCAQVFQLGRRDARVQPQFMNGLSAEASALGAPLVGAT